MNWVSIISDLQKSGMTQREIANHLSCSQSYISELKAGKKGKFISHHLGEQIANLWKEKLPPSA
ncbi:XRE family transcriptional regulator [Acinetobacter pollinis]|uniref:XRE family transcriptional regulator n=1 Tax=Acinetobacter pollinis TaxID=2605270 RepID=A0ABU6DNS2_9GAMM|nr:XRE family transcriptional regulator [Acinetobacter pollinis]MEB5475511.1 XRE family transcriptional regulator [Acinetobacter pollinis]